MVQPYCSTDWHGYSLEKFSFYFISDQTSKWSITYQQQFMLYVYIFWHCSWKQHLTKLFVQLITTYLSNHAGYCWASKDKLKQPSPMDSYTWTHQCWPTSKTLQWSALCRLWRLSRTLAKSDGWQGQMVWENHGNLCCWNVLMKLI